MFLKFSISFALAVIVIATAVSASPSGKHLLYPERRVPPQWRPAPKAAAVDLAATLTIVIGLKRRNMDKLEQAFWAVSDPAKAHTFGRHVTSAEEMRALVGATPQQIDAVHAWLMSAADTDGAARIARSFELNAHHDWIQVDLSLGEIESLLGVSFQMYERKDDATKRLARAIQQVLIPASLKGIVQTMSGFGGFPAEKQYGEPALGADPARPDVVTAPLLPVGYDPRPPHLKSSAVKPKLRSPQTNVTPALLYAVYNATQLPPVPAGKTNIQSFFQAQGQCVNGTDLSTFCETFFQQNCSITRTIGNFSNNAGTESSLDSEYISSMGRASETWVFSYMNFDFCGDLMRWAKDVFRVDAAGKHPFVISMSYGAQSLPNYCLGPDVARLSEETQKMGVLGVSVVIASGDDGSGETSRAGGFNYGYLSGSMPASMPFVTAVGSTTFVAGNAGQQMATTEFGSGGGFSSDYAAQSFQLPAIAGYFQNIQPPTQLPNWLSYNQSGRATPDVSGLGEGYNVISGGQWQSVGGTSCSTPMFAGLVTSLNNIRLRVGKTLGFLNVLLYGKAVAASGVTDITAGNNDVSSDGQGWYCATGWDPATGLGTPNFGNLATLVKGLNERDEARMKREGTTPETDPSVLQVLFGKRH